jgi:ABC-type spermidine/putrescine transport system permease subunit II
MTTITCLLATAVALLMIPLIILWRLSLTPKQNARRLRAQGLTYRAIGQRLRVSPTTARNWAKP